jgi:hypothetical protein
MRHRSLPAFAALLALFALGCATHPDSTPPDSTSPGGRTQVTGLGASGEITVTGSVESFTAGLMVLATDSGRETIRLEERTRGREHLLVGRRVSVDVVRGRDATVAAEIRPADEHDH